MRNFSRSLALVVAAGHAAVALGDVGNGAPLDGVLLAYPGVQVLNAAPGRGGARVLYGRTMNDGASPAQAANDFVNAHREAFGAGPVELTLREHGEANVGAIQNFVYAQTMGGLPVENAFLSVVVRTLPAARGLPQALVHATVLAQAVLAPTPGGGFAPDAITGEDALAGIGAMDTFKGLNDWTEPEQVVYFDPTRPALAPARAWKFRGSDIQAENPRSLTFFVDAASGALLATRNEIFHADITGSVVGLVTPPNRPDVPTNPAVQQPIGEVRVEVQGTSPLVFAFTARDGTFTIPWAGTDPVTLRVSVGGGRWSNVTTQGGTQLAVTQPATPGTPALINLLSSPTATTQAQVNGLFFTNDTHNFLRDRVSLDIDHILPTSVNEASTCNAFFTQPDSIHFFAAGGGCQNTAYASVVNHEYGHYIVNQRNLGQGAFGEGFSDCMSVMINDDPILGREFGNSTNFPPIGAVRHLDGTGSAPIPNYPCTGAIHNCGQVLGNIMWVITNNMEAHHGQAAGLALTRDLFADWTVVTAGGQVPSSGENAAHPGTAIEMLTVDDNDGNIFNGTPNNPRITPAFQARNIPAPCIEGRAQVTPGAFVPAVFVTGSQPITVPVTIIAGTASITPATAALKYRFGASGAFASVPMAQVGPPGSYTATLPTLLCGQAIQYYYSVETSEGEVTYPPHSCLPGATLSTQATDSSASFGENFEVNNPAAWTRVLGGGGSWVWTDFTAGSNMSTGANPTQDTTPSPGIAAWVTGRDFQTSPNAGDLDGTSSFTGPAYDLSAAAGAIVSYQRWFFLNNGNAGDEFRAEVSVDNGVTWHVGERLSVSEGAQWEQGGFSLGGLGLAPTAQVRLRFVGVDNAGTTDTTFEAAIDDLVIATLTCNTGTVCDSIDFNGDGLLPDVADISDFLTVFGGGACPTGTCGDIDFNNDTLFPDVADIESLLRVFAGGAC